MGEYCNLQMRFGQDDTTVHMVVKEEQRMGMAVKEAKVMKVTELET